MEAALPIEYVEFDPSVEDTGDVSNMSAEEYLSWVRHQAEKLPNVKRVEMDVLNRQSKYMPEVHDILSCPVDCLPSDEWQRELLYSFSDLRENLERMSQDTASKERRIVVPQMKDKEAWHRFCFAAELPATAAGINTSVQQQEVAEDCASGPFNENETMDIESNKNIESDQSTANRAMIKRKRDLACQLGITLVKRSDPAVVPDASSSSNLSYANSAPAEEEEENSSGEEESSLAEENEEVSGAVAEAWAVAARAAVWTGAVNVEPTTSTLLQFDQVLTQRLLALQIDWLEERELTPARGRWLYALLARLEKPLYRETAASIRQLYRRCCALRYSLSQRSSHVQIATPPVEGSSESLTPEEFQSQLATLNMLISICGSYFGQGEEYDAFNRALMEEAQDAEQQEEEGDWEEDEYGDEEVGDWEGGDLEVDDQMGEAVEGGTGEGCTSREKEEWVAVSQVVTSSHPSGRVSAGKTRIGVVTELEEGEEKEERDEEEELESSSKKAKT